MQERDASRSVLRIVVVGVASLAASPFGAVGREPTPGRYVALARTETEPPPEAAAEKQEIVEAEPRLLPWEHEMAISVAFSPDGNTLAVGSDQTVVGLFDPAILKERTVLRGHPLPRINDLAFSPDGATLAAANGDYFAQQAPGEVWLWNVKGEKVRAKLLGHKGHVWSVAFTPDGKKVVTCAADETVRVWDATTGDQRSSRAVHRGPVRRVAISPDGKLLASGGFDGTIKIWDLSSLEVKRNFPAHQLGVNGLNFSPDGTRLASSARFPSGDGVAVCLWDVATILKAAESDKIQPFQSLSKFRGRVIAIAFSPNGRLLATGGGAYGQFGELKFWDPDEGRLLSERELPNSVDSLAFSSDGVTLATASGVKSEKGDLVLWTVATTAPK